MALLDWLMGQRRSKGATSAGDALAESGVVVSLVAAIPPELMEAGQVLRMIEYVRGLPVEVDCRIVVFTFWAEKVGYQPSAADYGALKGNRL